MGSQVSRRRISRIMKEFGLVSKYTILQYKPISRKCNETKTANIVNRECNQDVRLRVVVSDLTYVRVGNKWHYICVLIDLYNREIIGFSSGKRKDAELVCRAFARVKSPLNEIQIFHTDRGKEFMNQLIDHTIEPFGIQRSLSMKGCPYDNAVAEATFKIIKTEFVYGQSFDTLNDLSLMLSDDVHGFNNYRIHSSLKYLTPVQYRMNNALLYDVG